MKELGVRRRGGNDARDLAIYLLKKEYGYSLKEIGDWFGVGFSAIGNRWHLMKRRVKEEPEWSRAVAKCKMYGLLPK